MSSRPTLQALERQGPELQAEAKTREVPSKEDERPAEDDAGAKAAGKGSGPAEVKQAAGPALRAGSRVGAESARSVGAGVMAGLVDFQDEEQVKSFLENMEVECHYQCYREKDPDGEQGRGASVRWARRGHVAGGGRPRTRPGTPWLWAGLRRRGRSSQARPGVVRALGLGTPP